MNRLELFEEMYDLYTHNLLSYSQDYFMTKPKAEFVEEWKETREKVDLVNEIIEEEKQKGTGENRSFTKEQILKMYPNVQYHVINSNGGLLAGTVKLEQAKKYAERYKREYLNDSVNKHIGVYVYDKKGKNIYVAKGIQNSSENEETEEFE